MLFLLEVLHEDSSLGKRRWRSFIRQLIEVYLAYYMNSSLSVSLTSDFAFVDGFIQQVESKLRVKGHKVKIRMPRNDFHIPS